MVANFNVHESKVVVASHGRQFSRIVMLDMVLGSSIMPKFKSKSYFGFLTQQAQPRIALAQAQFYFSVFIKIKGMPGLRVSRRKFCDTRSTEHKFVFYQRFKPYDRPADASRRYPPPFNVYQHPRAPGKHSTADYKEDTEVIRRYLHPDARNTLYEPLQHYDPDGVGADISRFFGVLPIQRVFTAATLSYPISK